MIRHTTTYLLCLVVMLGTWVGGGTLLFAQEASRSVAIQTLPTDQVVPTRARPKIGLVLSGGGARGLAHIGVLQWLEEHRIPVDYIAGTSMGGLVAAMYATGMSPAEMRKFVDDIDWDAVLSGPPDYDDLSFRRKEDRRTYPTTIELGARKGIQLPQGVNSGHYLGLIFDRLSLPYSTINSFDDLPIPFRCVATDMLAAKKVVISSGPLTVALRATMAVPGIFTPVETEDTVLADGGLLDNIPVDVAKDMGADIIIAVNVGTPLGTRDDLKSVVGMLAQVIGVTTIESDRRNLALANHVITPDLGKYTSIDFKAGDALADLGYQSATKQGSGIDAYSLSDADWKAHLAARESRARNAVYTPTALDVTGAGSDNAQSISRAMSNDVGRQLDPQTVDKQLSEIRGGGRYESLGYDIVQRDNASRLRIRVDEKTYGPPLLIPIVQFNSSDISDVELSLGGRLTMFDVGGYGSELRLDAIIGSTDLFAIEYYRPVGRSGFFVAPRAYFAANSANLYQSGDRVAEYRQRQLGAGLDLGIIFNRRTQLRAGYEVARGWARVNIGDPLLPDISGLISDASMRFVYDAADNAIIPTHGVRVTGEGHWFFQAPGAARAFPQVELRASAFMPVSEKGSFFVYGAGGTSFTRQSGPFEQFVLGGPFRLGAYGRGEFRGSNYVLGSGGYMHRVGYLPELIGGKIYATGWYEFGGAFNRSVDAEYQGSMSGAVLMETKLGAMTIGGAYGEGGRGRIFISLGRLF